MTPLPSPPVKPPEAVREPEDIAGMVLLWQSQRPDDRQKALEWADRNRVYARSVK